MLIKDIIDDMSEAKWDSKKVEQVVRFYNDFIHKNDDHIDFFGGNLIGINPIRFKSEDMDKWVEDICEVYDYETLKESIHSLKEIDPSRNVSSNPLNHLYAWAAHKIWSSSLPEKHRVRGTMAVLNMLQITFLTSLDKHYFPHKADETLAQSVYENLTRKSLLKNHGNWKGVIEYRSERLLEKSSIHYDFLMKMDDNEEVVLFINDIQTRVRKGYRNLASTFYELRDAEERILTNQAFIKNIDGEKVLREYSNRIEDNVKKIKEIVRYRNDFIKEDLLNDCLNLVGTASRSNVISVLEFITDNAGGKKQFDFTENVAELVIYINQFIKLEGINERDMPRIVTKLRSAIRAHRTTNKSLNELKEKLEGIVKRVIRARNEGILSATKVAVLLYLCLRILSIDYYN